MASAFLFCKNCRLLAERSKTCLSRSCRSILDIDNRRITRRDTQYEGLSSNINKANEDDCTQLRFNELHVQMLSKSLHQQIFGQSHPEPISDELFLKVKEHLSKFKLWGKKTAVLPSVDLQLPKMLGADVAEHFRELALKQTEVYRAQAEALVTMQLSPKPKKWLFKEGWTRYGRDGSVTAVAFPLEDGLVFDIETLVPAGQCPTMATAASTEAWYSWCSERLVQERFYSSQSLWTRDLIPLETARDEVLPPGGTWRQKLVIGHNVGFDRSFVKEQYYLKGPRTRFLDTMSLHIATNGLTSQQRMLFMAKKKGSQRKEVQEAINNPYFNESPMNMSWMEESSLNNLRDVHQLYTDQKPLQKELRDVFMMGTMPDIRADFQNLMTYCANDVGATHSIFQYLWPEFKSRFPHPVTLAGMLEMSTAYMPVNRNWARYIEASHTVFTALQHELKVTLMGLANTVCQMKHADRYEDDVWLWDLDWSSKELRTKKVKTTKGQTKLATSKERVAQLIQHAKDSVPKRPVHMPGYPQWYTELCPKLSAYSQSGMAGPSLISTQKRVTPRILRLTWQGYPLHYSSKLGWGYLVPGRPQDSSDAELDAELGRLEKEDALHSDQPKGFPIKSLYSICEPAFEREVRRAEVREQVRHVVLAALEEGRYTDLEDGAPWLWRQLAQAGHWTPKPRKSKAAKMKMADGPWFHTGDGPYAEVDIPGCWFFRLPHKDGPGNNTGNPLSKFHMTHLETGELQANCGTNVDKVLQRHVMCSYWKNNAERIRSQMVVRLRKEELPEAVHSQHGYDDEQDLGSLLPRVITAGTVTRRAVESTWPHCQQCSGSELKAMVQAPPGYKFVGADVDSQELWIAAILGDCNFAKLHGCTAFGWMTLLGNKADQTDLHSRIAEQVGITREQAKIFNYGRIYGAGKKFAVTLLQQFNQKLRPDEAERKASTLYSYSKGKRTRILTPSTGEDGDGPPSVAYRWDQGTESSMFNMLEKIATSQVPRTPVLGCRISKSLEPSSVERHFMPSRINWVVQSSAVDYLHLILVSMRGLMDEYQIEGRFSISIHDEVRYLVAEVDIDRAALALQVTNLLVRSMFALKMDMHDLPQAVAFFSSVDVDSCLRKEVDMDCCTPSNPRGLRQGYDLPPGESLTIYDIIERTGGVLSKRTQVNTSDEQENLKNSMHI